MSLRCHVCELSFLQVVISLSSYSHLYVDICVLSCVCVVMCVCCHVCVLSYVSVVMCLCCHVCVLSAGCQFCELFCCWVFMAANYLLFIIRLYCKLNYLLIYKSRYFTIYHIHFFTNTNRQRDIYAQKWSKHTHNVITINNKTVRINCKGNNFLKLEYLLCNIQNIHKVQFFNKRKFCRSLSKLILVKLKNFNVCGAKKKLKNKNKNNLSKGLIMSMILKLKILLIIVTVKEIIH